LLFSPISILHVTFKNSVLITPMATYAAIDGIPRISISPIGDGWAGRGAFLSKRPRSPNRGASQTAICGRKRATAQAHCGFYEGARRRARYPDRARRAKGPLALEGLFRIKAGLQLEALKGLALA
jgi:hypothetical protein